MDNKSLLNIKKYKTTFLVVLIVILSIILRLISIDKSNGLWFDEIYCHYIASQDFPGGIFDKLYNEDFHAPLYFVLLHFWMKMFGSSDLILRLFSCFFGVITVPVFYLLGTEVKSSNFGVVASFFAAVNSILIYYSQEVKFYSLLFLLSSLFLLFLIKYLKKQDKLNYCALIISNVAILYTFTLGFLYLVCVNTACLFFLYKNNKQQFKSYLKLCFVVVLLYLPYLPFIVHQSVVLSKFFVSLTEVFYFSVPSALTTIQMWFSPVIYNLVNGVPIVLSPKELLSVSFFIFGIFPVLLCLFALVKTLQQKGLNAFLVSINIIYIFLMFVSASFRQFAFVPRFILLAMPSLLLYSAYGLYTINNAFISKLLISVFIYLNLFYLIFVPASAPFIQRNEGYNSVAKILKSENIDKKDIVMMPFSGRFLSRYFDANILDFDFSDIYIRNKNNSLSMILPNKVVSSLTKKNAREKLKPYIFSTEVPKGLENYLYKNVYNKLEKGSHFVVVINKNYYFGNNLMQKMRKKNSTYLKIPLHHILYTKFISHLLAFSFKNLSFKTVVDAPDDVWEIYFFTKEH